MAERNRELLRALHPEDIPAAFRLSAQVGWNQTEEDWHTLLELAPEGCLAMEVDGQLAATTTLLCYGRRLAWIGMVLTSPEYRRRGLARKLLARVLDQADQMGMETVKLDATDQGQPLYEKFGFHREREIERWSRPGGEVAWVPIAQTPEEKVWRNHDLPVFGADRSQLLDKLARLHPPIVFAQSYLFARPGRKTAYLGPCIGESQEAARRLVEGRIKNTDCAWSWDLFPGNRDAAALARDLGFTPQRCLLRMARGKELREKDDAIYAIAGFELG
jgi:ribosomal protein S18 acetylase RimI-like enzyme